jgi:hypothetical protein
MSQARSILKFIRAGNWIDPIIARDKFHCLALSQRMGNIEGVRHKRMLNPGEVIERGWLRFPSGARVRRYRMARKAK